MIAISSRALFDLEQSDAVFRAHGAEAYIAHQIEREQEVLPPGVAFPLIRKLLALNEGRAELPRVEVILLSRNNADAGLRILHSIQSHGLQVRRAAFTTGRSPYKYAQAFQAHLFLSTHPQDVRDALAAGLAAATVLGGGGLAVSDPEQAPSAVAADDEIRIAFDGDAVLFSDESERVYKTEGLQAFRDHEAAQSSVPLQRGPFAVFLRALHHIQQAYPPQASPIRTALVTARGAPSHERVVRTLRHWDIRIDEALFLDGQDKGEFLRAFRADFFFDDQYKNVESAARFVNTAHVLSGIANE